MFDEGEGESMLCMKTPPPPHHFLNPPLSVLSPSTASNSNKSTPACSPVLRKRSRSPTPQTQEGENMVEKGSDHSSDKSPSTPEQVVQRTYSLQSARSGGKNSKVRRKNRLLLQETQPLGLTRSHVSPTG